MFETTQGILPTLVLMNYINDIQENFDIEWSSVEWKDLRKPLYSALGARLYILYKSRIGSDSIPWSIEEQAKFWQTHYRPDGDELHFNTLATKFENREYKCMVIERGGPRTNSSCFMQNRRTVF